jgi:hypothetical protein
MKSIETLTNNSSAVITVFNALYSTVEFFVLNNHIPENEMSALRDRYNKWLPFARTEAGLLSFLYETDYVKTLSETFVGFNELFMYTIIDSNPSLPLVLNNIWKFIGVWYELLAVLLQDDETSRSHKQVSFSPEHIIPTVHERRLTETTLIRPTFSYNTSLNVDLTTGTIDGKYFRMDSDGTIMFNEYDYDNLTVKPFTSPDIRFTMYPDEKNDLTLLNLYSSTASEKHKNINYGTFMLSQSASTIMNMSYIISDYKAAFNLLRFNNEYAVSYKRDGIDALSYYTMDGWQSFDNLMLKPGVNSITNVPESLSHITESPHVIIVKHIIVDELDIYGNFVKTLSETHNFHLYDMYNETSLSTTDINSELGQMINDYIMNSYTKPSTERVETVKTTRTTTKYYRIVLGITDVAMYYHYYNKIPYYSLDVDSFNINIRNIAKEQNNDRIQTTSTVNNGMLTIRDIQSDIDLHNVCLGTKQFMISTGEQQYSGTINVITVNDKHSTHACNDVAIIYGTITESTDVNIVLTNNVVMFSGTACNLTYDPMMHTFNSNSFNISTFNATQHALSNTATASTVIKDTFGNDINLNSHTGDISFVNGLFDTIADIINVPLTQSGKDVSNNTIRNEYMYNNGTKVLSVLMYTINTLNNTEEHQDLFIERNNDELKCVMREYVLDLETKRIKTEMVMPLLLVDSGRKNVIVCPSIMMKLTEFETKPNENVSNAFRAYKYSGFDFINQWWNRNMYVQSLMLTQLPFMNKELMYKDVIIPRSGSDTKAEMHFMTSLDSDTVLYTYDESGALNRLYGEYVVNRNGVYNINKGLMKPINFESLYVYNGRIQTYNNTDNNMFIWYSVSRDIDVDTVEQTIMLYDEDGSVKYKLDITVVKFGESARINRIIVFENVPIYTLNEQRTEKTLIGNDFMYLCEYTDGVQSNIPIYIDDLSLMITFSTVILATEKRLTISEISIATTDIKCVEYKYVKPTKENDYTSKVLERNVHTMRFSNIPGEFVNASGALDKNIIALNIPMLDHYMYYSCVKYAQNSFVNPKYTTKSGKYIMVVEKQNQNLCTNNVVLRNTYAIGHVDTKYNIANAIQSNTEHVLESVNSNYLLVGGVNKSGLLNDIAINCNSVSIVPLSNKMILSIEFT